MQQLNSGVYQIKNLISGNIYIGSSQSLDKRWYIHLLELGKQKHHNKPLQRAYNKIGKDNLAFEILIKCPPEYLIKMEQWFLDNLNPSYNTCKTAGSVRGIKRSPEFKKQLSERFKGNTIWKGRKHREDSKRLLSLKLTGKPKSKEHIEKIRLCKQKPIVQYNLDGSFVKEWTSITEAASILNLCGVSICANCKFKLKQSQGFIWRHKHESLIVNGNYVNLFTVETHWCKLNLKKKKVLKRHGLKRGYKLDSEHSRKISESMKKRSEAMDKNSLEYIKIIEHLKEARKKIRLSPNFKEQIKNVHLNNRKQVVQYSLSGEIIKVWASIQEAATSIGLRPNSLSNTIGKYKKDGKPCQSGGYVWKLK